MRSAALVALLASAVCAGAQAQEGRREDANVDRGWFMPTAMTQPAGSFSFNDYELVLMGVTWAPSDRVQLTLTALVPLAAEMCCFGIVGLKARVLDAGALHLALLGSIAFANMDSVDLYGDGAPSGRATAWAALAGATASLCFAESCNAMVSAFLTTGFNQYSDTREWPFIYGASLTAGGAHIKLLLEADSAALIGDVSAAARGGLFTYGVRFTSGNLAGDVGFSRPFGKDVDMGSLVMGVPILTFTYRAL